VEELVKQSRAFKSERDGREIGQRKHLGYQPSW